LTFWANFSLFDEFFSFFSNFCVALCSYLVIVVLFRSSKSHWPEPTRRCSPALTGRRTTQPSPSSLEVCFFLLLRQKNLICGRLMEKKT
jgi:hypothetical protein